MAGKKGRSGRKARPAAWHKAMGTYRPAEHGAQMEAPAGTPVPPSWMREAAAKDWEEIVAILSEVPGLITKIDGAAIAAYAEAVCDYRDACVAVDELGSEQIGYDRAGNRKIVKNPAVQRKQEAWKRICECHTKFGMNPYSRATLKIGYEQKTADPFSELQKEIVRLHKPSAG